MKKQWLKLCSWTVGVGGAVGICYYYGFDDLVELVSSLPLICLLSWAALTLIIRIFMTETLVRPIVAMGGHINRFDAFCMGWIKTFFNQIVPMSGIAYLAGFVKVRSEMEWGNVAALTSPLLLLASQATAFVGFGAVLFNATVLGNHVFPLAMIFVAVGVLAVSLNSTTIYRLRLLPDAVRRMLAPGVDALGVINKRPFLAATIFFLHVLILLLRSLRLLILFWAAGFDLSFGSVLLITALGSIALLVQITPGGIGLQEGILVASSSLLGIDPVVTAGMAVVDRLLTLSFVGLMTAPATWYLHVRDKGARI